ncbi:MAG: hypothetical protein IBGAMO2_340028 [Arenicellales bacterium IbO2]|nr:hypothetical protein [Gammaproteobacteria bacterium]MDA8024203.1 hypothetical protein [Gammaproteobacteria bacterium]CAJ2376444.1 MAG: hypothetical protein IBGAMO2_340028 [Arenicellales bacterium IbO2]
MAEDMMHNAFPEIPETLEPMRRNPHYSRWNDPFVFMSRDYIAGVGDGDIKRGHDKILRRFIKGWNESVKRGKATLPLVSFERGQEWIPVLLFTPEAEAENKRRKYRFEKRKAKEAEARRRTARKAENA